MDRRAFLGTLSGGVPAAPLAGGAQQAGKVWRIRFTGPTTRVQRSLRDRLPELAADLVRAKIDVNLRSDGPWQVP